MKTKKINQHKTKHVDSKKDFTKKALYTLAGTAAVLSGTNANAVNLGQNDVWGDDATGQAGLISNPGSAIAVNLNNHSLTIGNAGATLQSSIGAINATQGTQQNQILVTQASIGSSLDLTILSIAGVANDLVLTTDAGGTGAVTVTVSGTTILADKLTLTNANTATIDAAGSIVLNQVGNLAVGGATLLTAKAHGTAGGADATLNLTGAAIFTGNMTMDDDVGSTFLNLVGTGAQAIAGTIKGTGADEGTIKNSNTGGTVAFAATLGANTEMLLIETVAGSTTTYAAAVDAGTMTLGGSNTFAVITKADTMTITGTTTIDAVNSGITLGNTGGSTHTAMGLGSSGVFTMTMATSEATVLDAKIDGTVAGYGTVNITSANAAAAGVVTLNDNIGATRKIGTLNVGSATVGGSLISIDGATIISDTVNVLAGNAANEASTLELKDSLTAAGGILLVQNTDAASDAILKTSDILTITGTINASGATAGNSDIQVTGSSKVATFASAIGDVLAVDVLSIDTASAVFQGNVDAVSMTLANAAGTATFSGTSAQTFTGAMTATNGEGTLVSSNAVGMTYVGGVGVTAARLKEISVADAAMTTFSNITAAITLDIDTNASGEQTTFLTAGHIVGTASGNAGALQIAGGDIKLGTGIVADDILFDVTTAAADADGVLIATAGVTFIAPSNFTSGTITLINGDEDAITPTELGDIFAQDTVLTDYTISGTTEDVTMTATRKTSSAIAIEMGVTDNEAKALGEIMAAAVASDAALVDILQTAMVKGGTDGTGAAATKLILEQAAPQTETSAGTVATARATTGAVQNIMSDRMASLRSGDAYVSGMSAGSGMSANSAFIQAFGSQAEQKNTKKGAATIYGYDSETSGVALGLDGVTDSGSVVGLSISASSTDLDGKGKGSSKNKVDSYTASLYTDKVTDAGYLEASLTYGISENSSSRSIKTSGIDRVYSAAFDSEQVSLKVGGGVPNDIGDGSFITPFGSLTGTVVSTDHYTETSTTASDALRLKVSQDDVTSLMATVGVKAHKVTDKGTPMFSLALNQEFGDSSIDSQNTFTGGGVAINNSVAVEEMSATLGVGYSVGSDTTSLNIGYEAEADDNEYLSHYGSIKITSKF